MSLEIVKKLRPCEFEWKQRSGGGKKNIGFIAQEVAQIFPIDDFDVVQTDGEYLKIQYAQLIPVLVKAIQELEAKVKMLEEENVNKV